MGHVPFIRLPRGSQVLAERGASSATLHIQMRANPPASLQWFHNGRPLSRFESRYTMTDNYLQISQVADFDAGLYLVRAQNGIQSAAEATLQLIVYPLFPTMAIKAKQTLFEPGDDRNRFFHGSAEPFF